MGWGGVGGGGGLCDSWIQFVGSKISKKKKKNYIDLPQIFIVG